MLRYDNFKDFWSEYGAEILCRKWRLSGHYGVHPAKKWRLSGFLMIRIWRLFGKLWRLSSKKWPKKPLFTRYSNQGKYDILRFQDPYSQIKANGVYPAFIMASIQQMASIRQNNGVYPANIIESSNIIIFIRIKVSIGDVILSFGDQIYQKLKTHFFIIQTS